MSAAFISHPLFGSLWLEDARVEGDYVVGLVEDRSVPEGRSVMNFPLSCVRRWR